MSFDLSDYVDARTRIQIWWQTYPNGSIVTSEPALMPGRDDMVYMVARVYADRAQTELVATGTAAELTHGKTPYTKDSELMNLETSAIARAIGAAGIGISKGMASLNEVIRSQELEERRQRTPAPAPAPPPVAQVKPQETEVDPWGAPVDLDATMCIHGAMKRKTGTKKNGDPYSGWVCTYDIREEQCKAIWD